MTVRLGAGIAYRPEYASAIDKYAAAIDFLEIGTEYWMRARPWETARVAACGLPYVLHGMELSPGSVDGLDETYVRAFESAVRRSAPVWCSDHLSVSRAGATVVRGLTPVRFTDENAATIGDQLRSLRERIGTEFLVENIAPYFEVPGGTMSESAFFAKVLERSGCGMILDLTNLYAASVNVGTDIDEFLAEIPLDAVVEVHLAGGEWSRGRYIDTHSAPVPEEVWSLFERLAAVAPLRAVVLERDRDQPPFEALLDEIARARSILAR